ncbi:MAG: hypothetical protein UT86_C0004G0056 [Candidatus Magasanikbacteria bacterium GW2011_GWC2_40_17]|uniref:Pyruvate flavodoxin/ferredoxin oxidoreductase domain protein n=1 Tax=Candidatus Magasanikbacteria bacterium GW2011_GWA2_42_32 TaxID=1619039 RepID=A0A0G1A874_9BACT|nr:MAG: hypothetical protein UT86_C0004G0056 [Candidatus Magasanikbacteria bacterium GW2011_GWC2_40_17]KKS57114.1 MAG: hypothetical protein UV20_C0003G0056 [Candidatus Magasanikbacteria bacterium GW2011_GWA2_42_32]OGH85364.1 MAG: hypothetical protein A2294_01180 [Candidatus Magasanikbacteria bacterium RIFOXYB2_FULL_38_10]
MTNKKLATGFEAVTEACFDAGAKMMFGYPITPVTEVFTTWIKKGGEYLQTEDEIAAGFGVCGGLIAGQKAFTATSGPGHILMQDALSMAEGMRLPFVAIIGQRGGPSSGTVIYSQQEVTLACFGGNGEGLRLVYSPATIEELYSLTREAFNAAWKYQYPTIVLTDGYLLKSRGVLAIDKKMENVESYPLVKEGEKKHWRNIYTFEEELNEEVLRSKADFEKNKNEVVRWENYQTEETEILIVAHGIVGAAAKEAIDELRKNGLKVGLFRPITLRPFANKEFDKIAGRVKKIVIVESSLGQLAQIVRAEMAPEISTPVEYLQYPALGIEAEKIVEYFK